MKLVWTAGARIKLKQIVQYIAADNPSAAIKYGNEIFERVEKLLQFPEAGIIFSTNGSQAIRRIIIGKTKSVFYRASKTQIFILAVHDNRQMLKQTKKAKSSL